jgi:NDP-sugar pyrophosphorylase family protein
MLNGQNIFTGSGCELSGSAHIRDAVLWDNVRVAENASLYRTIVADGVTIAEGEHYENAAIVRAEMVRSCDDIPEKAPKGYIQGDNYIVPLI